MDIQQHERLIRILTDEFHQKTASVSYTQWETEGDDEEVTQFRGQLGHIKLTDNEFGEKDLLLVFIAEDGDEVEILMEIPGEEVDLATYEEGRLSIFGTEAEIVLAQ